jgi:hypothetical protein
MKKKTQKRPAKKMKPAGTLIKAKSDAKLEKQYLPLSKSTFSNYIEDNCIYVDKTRYIHPLVQAGALIFYHVPGASANP